MHIFHIRQAPSSIKISKAEWRYQNSLTIIVPPEKSVALWRPTVLASLAPTHHFFSDNETSSGFNEVLVGQVERGGAMGTGSASRQKYKIIWIFRKATKSCGYTSSDVKGFELP